MQQAAKEENGDRMMCYGIPQVRCQQYLLENSVMIELEADKTIFTRAKDDNDMETARHH